MSSCLPYRLYIGTTLAVCIAAPALGAGVNLRISDDETFKRPNAWSSTFDPGDRDEKLFAETTPLSRPGISIAWRNANQVEEVEVRVQNVGDRPGIGRVHVTVVDAEGAPLLDLRPPEEMSEIRIPAYEQGGREGKIIRMAASWELNALIDRFDRTRTRYGVVATVDTVGDDADWSDNRKIKEWNIPYRVRPGEVNVFNYTFRNTAGAASRVRWRIDQSAPPDGWRVEGLPHGGTTFVMAPGQAIGGVLLLRAPAQIAEGAFLETRLALVAEDSGKVLQQHEWFQVYDTEPPGVTNYRAVLLQDHTVAIQALVADKSSGVLEATGVSTEFSADNGRTWAVKSHNYKVGNFIRPTLFETVLGPFAPNTRVLVRFTALDTAGNAQSIIPADASAFVAPPLAERLIQQAYVFPRTQQNPVFDLERLKRLSLTLQKLKEAKVDIAALDLSKPNELGIDATQLAAIGMDSQRLADLRDDLARLADLELDLGAIRPVELKRVKAIGEGALAVSTLEVEVP